MQKRISYVASCISHGLYIRPCYHEEVTKSQYLLITHSHSSEVQLLSIFLLTRSYYWFHTHVDFKYGGSRFCSAVNFVIWKMELNICLMKFHTSNATNVQVYNFIYNNFTLNPFTRFNLIIIQTLLKG